MSQSFNIAGTMETQAQARPAQRAVVFPQGQDKAGRTAWTQLSFEALNRLTDEYARGFIQLGIKKGDRVSLLVKPCLEFIPLTFAIFKIGALPVLIDPGMGREGFLSCIARIEPKVLIAEPIVHALRGLFSASFKSVKISITVGRSTWFWGGRTLDACRVPSQEPFAAVSCTKDEEAAILFTSGSTGPAKGVTYTHGIFNAQTRLIQQMYNIEPGEIDLACFPLFGLFSMAMGMTVVIPKMDPTKPAKADPKLLVSAIQEQGCTSAFGSPAIWKNVALYCTQEGIQLPSMKRILMAGAPVPVWMHEAFAKVLLGAEVHTPYGATESLPVASTSSAEVLSDTHAKTREGAGTCVGKPVPGITARIIRITDEPIETWSDDLLVPQGTIGELCVRGEVITPEYKSEPQHTKAAKIIETIDGEKHICHRIGDVGYLDSEGRIWFCGRKSHRVVLKDGSTMFTVPCEAIFNEHPQVYRTALVGVDGEPVIIVELEPDAAVDKVQLARTLIGMSKKNARTERIERLLFHPGFPVDVRHNAKIHRGELARWAAQQTPIRITLPSAEPQLQRVES